MINLEYFSLHHVCIIGGLQQFHLHSAFLRKYDASFAENISWGYSEQLIQYMAQEPLKLENFQMRLLHEKEDVRSAKNEVYVGKRTVNPRIEEVMIVGIRKTIP